MLIFYLFALIACDTAWVSVTTSVAYSWTGSDEDIVFCVSDNSGGFECCNPDREGIDDYEPGLSQAWTFTNDFINPLETYLLCNMGEDGWIFDARLNVDGTEYEQAVDVCTSMTGPLDCGSYTGDNCIMWDNYYYYIVPYPVTYDEIVANTIGMCPNYDDTVNPPDSDECDVYNDPTCPNYEGTYDADRDQYGFDDEQFEGDYTDEVTAIDDILEALETDFENEAAQWELDLQAYFDDKESSYIDVTNSEDAYVDAMNDRLSAESNYNLARADEEVAHVDLLDKISLYDAAVLTYQIYHASYVDKIDFLNYELFIIQQIRELLGEEIGYVPEQIILEITPYDDTYDGWATMYPNLLTSSFDHEDQRFGLKRRKRVKRRKKRRKRKRRRSRSLQG